jgi:DNA-directed RNA polymerase specialized sigma24 family protein
MERRVFVSTDDDLAELLTRSLAGDEAARCRLYTRLDPWLHRRAKLLSPPDFESRGLLDDVASHAWELLLRRRPGAFDPGRGGPVAYLVGVLRTAIRDIRDSEARVTGPVRRYTGTGPAGAQHLADRRGIRRRDPDALDDRFDDVAGLVDLDASLAGYPNSLATAVKLIGLDDMTIVATATNVGSSRFALKRHLSNWATAVELTAVA